LISIRPIKNLIKYLIPFEIRRKIGLYLEDLSFQRYIEEKKKFKSADIFIVSFPKCGRTWLRLMIGKALINHFNLKVENPLILRTLHNYNAEIPRVAVTHDEKTHKKTGELKKSKLRFRDKKVILLVRDPRDVVVSLYFHYRYRERRYHGELSDFIRERLGSLDTLIMYYNIWAKQRHVPKDFLLVCYENIHKNSEKELQKVLHFMNINYITEKEICESVEWSRFDNMKKMERENRFNSSMLSVECIEDEESYKVRKGKIGGYKEYLSDEDILYINQKISTNLSDYYWYYKDKA
jgi:Sulfotransferase domain